MPPSKIQQLSRKLRSSKKIHVRKKKLIFKANKQKPSTKKFRKTKVFEKVEHININSAQVPDKNKSASSMIKSEEESNEENNQEKIENNFEKTELKNIKVTAAVESEELGNINIKERSKIVDTEVVSNAIASDEKINEKTEEEDIILKINDMSSNQSTEDNDRPICTVCNMVTDSSASLTIHMKQHSLTNNQTHQCLVCSKSLSSASSLDRHMLVHSGERPFKCKLCDMSFTTNGNMHRHMRTHGEFDTSDISKSLDLRKKDVKCDILDNSKSVEKLHCPVCGKTFLCRYGLQSHMDTHPNDPIKCPKCQEVSVNYIAHIDHKCCIQNSGSPVKCYNSISQGFQDLNFMDFTCNKFSLVSKSYCEQNIKRPSSAFHIFECFKCNKAFPCSRALKLHQKIHETNIGTFCPGCQCDFTASSFLQIHQLKHRSAEHCFHDSNFTEPQEPEHASHAGKEDFLALLNLQTKQSQLSILKQMDLYNVKEDDFENMDYFVHGKVIKNTPKTDTDGNNNNDFADIQSIISLTSKASSLITTAQSSPIAVQPTSPLPYSTTKQPKSPQIAESASASPEIPSKEETVSVPDNHDDQDMPDTDSSDVVRIYSCNICSQQFKNIGALKRHSKLHVQRGSNYSCHLCSYVSVDKSTLIRHLRTHNGERPFQCVICKYAFTTKANCERHVRKRHKKFGKAEIRSAMQYNPNMSLRGSDPTSSDVGSNETVCKYCGVDFKFNRVLRHHLRSLHNSCSRKPFSCKICKFGFSTKNNCIRHVLKQHPNLKDKLRSVVIPNSLMNQFTNCEDSLQADTSNCSSVNPVSTEQAQPLDLHCEISEKPLDLQTEKSSNEFPSEAVIAAEGLVSLSEAVPLQDEPLDLAAHPLDLTCKPLAAITPKVASKASSMCNAFPSTSKPVPSIELSASKSLTPNKLPKESIVFINSNYKQLEHVNQNEIALTSSGQKLRSFTCIYCKAGFTLKSNMERHIKRKHPEFARPTRSRNYIPSIVTPSLQKQSQTTLSDKTRDALRHVLNNKVQQVPVFKTFNSETFPKLGNSLKIVTTTNNFITQPNNTNNQATFNLSIDLSGKQKNITILDLNRTNIKLSANNNEENCSDLASVSSVICTANSPQFKQYLEKPTEIEKLNVDKKESKASEVGTVKKGDMPSVSCPFCERKFPWTSSLRRHILTHTGQKPFKCPKCSLWFTTKSNCERHLVRKHGHKGDLITRTVPDRPYKCNHCLTSTFSTQGNLRKHFYLKHWTKSYLGMNCKPIQLDKSIPVAENKSKLLISSITSQEHSYSQVEKVHTFGCHFCDDSFESIKELRSHMTKHNVVYICYLCKKTFQNREICLSHFKTSHSLVYTQIVENENVSLNSLEIQSNETTELPCPESKSYPFACMVCFQKVSSFECLQLHMKQHLTKENSTACRSSDSVKDEISLMDSKSKLNQPKSTSPINSKKIKSPKSKVKNSLLYFLTPSSTCSSSVKSIKNVTSKLDLVSPEENSDLIQNLLGIHDSKMIDEMLQSADSAARLLGVKEV